MKIRNMSQKSMPFELENIRYVYLFLIFRQGDSLSLIMVVFHEAPLNIISNNSLIYKINNNNNNNTIMNINS